VVVASTFGRRAALLALVLCAIALTAGSSAGPRSASAADSRAAAIGVLRICTNCASTGGDLSRYGYVILHAWESSRIPDLKAKNPGIKVLVYKDMAATYSYACHAGADDALLPAGVGYCASDGAHPDWFLSDTTGQRVQFCDYSGLWQMDVGNAAYQDAWLASVAGELKQRGWDGVVIDDTNNTEKYHLCGRTLAKYPTASAYEAATRSFLAKVGPALTGQGRLVLPNINFDCWEACFSSFIQYTSGAVREWWTKNGTDAAGQYSGDNWNWSNGFLRLAQQQGKTFIAITYGPQSDARSQRYARASFLLDWNGGASALIFEAVPEATDPWSPEWTQDVGTPRGARYAVGGAWRRDYSGGTVLVNPSASAAVRVDLGASYLTAAGAAVQSVTLDPMSGVILRNAASTTPPPPPAPAAPANTSPPSISGRPEAGLSLSANPGAWSGSPAGYAYAWQRCAADGNGCSAISGAAGKTYELGSADVGSTLRVRVTATNAGGATSALSAASRKIRAGAGTRLLQAVRTHGVVRRARPTTSGRAPGHLARALARAR
jgi:hypothetical protein